MSALFKDKTAFIIGGTYGIGAEITKAFVREGTSVVALHYDLASNSQRYETLEFMRAVNAIAKQDSSLDPTSFAIEVKRSRPDGKEHLLRVLSQELKEWGNGKIDILINCRQISRQDWIDDINHASQLVDVTGGDQFVRLVLPLMRDGGKIINLANGLSPMLLKNKFSEAAREAAWCEENYSSWYMAHADTRLAAGIVTRRLADELRPQGITVNAIAPNITRTPGLRDCLGTIEDIAAVAVKLASSSFGHMTGKTVWSPEVQPL